MTLLDTKSNRILIEAPLKPIQGQRFQPTGFADLGAATYELPDGTRMLLVESAQSMANRLEKVCVAGDGVSLIRELEGLPYVEVQLDGGSSAKTSSLVEAHRLNSPFILKAAGFEEVFRKAIGFEDGKAVDWQHAANGVFNLDPCSLVHGVFMANFEDGRVRFPRAITAFIEAAGVGEANSGGVKNNAIDPTGTLQVVGYGEKVYSNVPYARTEYVAKTITAFFALDVELFRSFALGDPATKFLVALSLYKIRRFLEGGMRLRTACDLVLAGDVKVTMPAGSELPSSDELLKAAQAGIRECKGLFADPAITKLKAPVARKAEKPKAQGDGEAAGEDEGDEDTE